MSKYGLKIKNIEAGSLYGYQIGVRDNYDTTNAMLTNSLFSDFLIQNGLNIYKEESTRDIICIEFNYGTRDYEDEIKHLKKTIKKTNEDDEISDIKKQNKINKLEELLKTAEKNKDKYQKKSAQQIRDLYYTQGVEVKYDTKNRKYFFCLSFYGNLFSICYWIIIWHLSRFVIGKSHWNFRYHAWNCWFNWRVFR